MEGTLKSVVGDMWRLGNTVEEDGDVFLINDKSELVSNWIILLGNRQFCDSVDHPNVKIKYI